MHSFNVLFLKIILNFTYPKYRQATNVNYLNVLKQHIKHAVGLSHTGTDKTQKQSHIHNNAVPIHIHTNDPYFMDGMERLQWNIAMFTPWSFNFLGS